jgi:phosphate uptake regulator
MREQFHEELDALSDVLVEMTRLVGSAIDRATIALLDADLALAESVIGADEAVDALQIELEERSLALLARQAPFTVLLDGEWEHGIETAVDVTLCGRYYERFADHAVSVAQRVTFLVTGERRGAREHGLGDARAG